MMRRRSPLPKLSLAVLAAAVSSTALPAEPVPAESPPTAPAEPATVIVSYGEINLNRPSKAEDCSRRN